MMEMNGYLRRNGTRWFVEVIKENGNNKEYSIIGNIDKPLARLNRKVSFIPHGCSFLTLVETIVAGWDYYRFG